jgi:hypothetical protein
MVSGGEDGVARLFEVQTGRLIRKWDLGDMAKVVEKDDEVSLLWSRAV